MSNNPVFTKGNIQTLDNRNHKYGSFTYKETTDLIKKFEKETQSSNTVESINAFSMLVDIYIKRKMLKNSYIWINQGLKKHPDALILKYKKRELNKITADYKKQWENL